MDYSNLDDMFKGWFVGNFSPTALSTPACEVGVKKYKAGDKEESHFHKIGTEVTLILSGSVSMNGMTLHEGQIVKINPGEATDFKAITDVITVVVKTPSAVDDKYIS